MPVAKATLFSGRIQGPEGPCSLRHLTRILKREGNFATDVNPSSEVDELSAI
jgi:hypothetical protein